MFKYNESSLVCNFIQNILRNKYVPTIPIFTNPDDELGNQTEKIKDFPLFIYNNKIYSRKANEDTFTDTFIEDWELGKRYPNLTSNYISTHNYYSTETHEQLGEYLRAYSKFYKIDLMAFYNCFSNRSISSFSLPLYAEQQSKEKNNDNVQRFEAWYKAGSPSTDKYKVTCFPIKPNTEYDIKIYSNVGGSIILQPIFYNGLFPLKIEKTVKATTTEGSTGEDKKTPIVFNPTTVPATNEFSYELSLTDVDELKITLNSLKYLYLFIQVPTTQRELLISVVERSPYFNTINKRLLNLDVNYNVPFSDRLLEYLTGNVITRNDRIKQNIARIQTIITSNEFTNDYLKNSSFYDDTNKKLFTVKPSKTKDQPVPPYNNIGNPPEKKDIYTPIKGIYDDNMRLYLYNAFINKMNRGEIPKLYDFNGYVDKDVEQLLINIVAKSRAQAAQLGTTSLLDTRLREI